ncbi:hypothetical protein BH09ACT10_BH09ACT10_25840 [soil metagenome]
MRKLVSLVVGIFVLAGLIAPMTTAEAAPATGTIKGRVLNAKGKPVKNMWVIPTCDKGGTMRCGVEDSGSDPEIDEFTDFFIDYLRSGPSAAGGVKTNANGRFKFTDMPKGRYTLDIDNPFDKYIATTKKVTVKSATVSRTKTTVKVGGKITGSFLTKDGAPVADGIISVMQGEEDFNIGLSTGDGHYQVTGIKPGRYFVAFQRDLFGKTVWFDNKLRLPYATKIRVVKGKPLHHVDVRF